MAVNQDLKSLWTSSDPHLIFLFHPLLSRPFSSSYERSKNNIQLVGLWCWCFPIFTYMLQKTQQILRQRKGEDLGAGLQDKDTGFSKFFLFFYLGATPAGIISGRLGGPHGVLGIEPRLVCSRQVSSPLTITLVSWILSYKRNMVYIMSVVLFSIKFNFFFKQ